MVEVSTPQVVLLGVLYQACVTCQESPIKYHGSPVTNVNSYIHSHRPSPPTHSRLVCHVLGNLPIYQKKTSNYLKSKKMLKLFKKKAFQSVVIVAIKIPHTGNIKYLKQEIMPTFIAYSFIMLAT